MNGRFRDLFDIAGRVAIITGAGGGIGRILTEAFAELRAQVVASDLTEPAGLPNRTVFCRTDLRDRQTIDALAEFVYQRFGRVDILVNNAGVAEWGRAEDMPLEMWSNTLSVNLNGTFLCSQVIGRLMIAQRAGSIVNITSRCGYIGMPYCAAYNASKAGISSLTQTLAVEWASYGVRVNAIVPGFVRTPHTAATLADPEATDITRKGIPLGRISDPEDLVGAAVFFASEASRFATGAVLFVDGGTYASGGVSDDLRLRRLARGTIR